MADVRKRRILVSMAVAFVDFLPDLLQCLTIVGGWAFLTFGLAELFGGVVWPISLGLFLLSIAGWGYLVTLFRKGLYVMSRSERDG